MIFKILFILILGMNYAFAKTVKYQFAEPGTHGNMELEYSRNGDIRVKINTFTAQGRTCTFSGVGKKKNSRIIAKDIEYTDEVENIEIRLSKRSAYIKEPEKESSFCGLGVYLHGRYVQVN